MRIKNLVAVLLVIGIISPFLLSSCVTPSRNADNQFEYLSEVVYYVRSGYVESFSDEKLAGAAIAGMNKKLNTAHYSENVQGTTDPWKRFRNSYYDALKTSPDKTPKELIEGAITGIIEILDPLSKYVTPEEMRESKQPDNEGSVGLSLQRINKKTIIQGTIEGSYASALQLEKGDRLLKINGESIDDLDLATVVSRLRGIPGSKVRLTIERDSTTFDAIATRLLLSYYPITSEVVTDGIVYVRIHHFYQRAGRQFSAHILGMSALLGANLRGIVVDLRNNAGGILTDVVSVADAFLDDGLILSTYGRGPDSKLRFFATVTKFDIGTGVPLVVLVNRGTGSGAEMLAGILQDRKRARIVGTTTAGIGSIQTRYPIKNGGQLQLTTAQMYRPNGDSISTAGIMPDICVVEGKPIFLKSIKTMKEDDIRTICPAAVSSEQHEDVELRLAIDLLRGKKI